MSKKFTNVVDRGRVVPHKYNFVDNKNGTTTITDIPSNINVQGTKFITNIKITSTLFIYTIFFYFSYPSRLNEE